MTTRVKTTGANGSDTALAAVILGAAAVVGVLWLGGAAAGMITGHSPGGDLLAGVRAVGHAADPGAAWSSPMPGPGVYWTVTGLVLAAGTALAILAVRRFDAGPAPADVYRLPGTATRTHLRRTCSRRAVTRRGRLLRPSIHRPDAAEVGFRIGASRGVGVWSSVEDSVVVVGPARSGKDLHLVVNVILDAPGAVIATSTRPDNIHQTITARTKAGPVAVFDPQHLAGDTPAGLRWSLTRGCDQPMTAMIRAAALAAGTGNGVDDGDFWRGQTEAALRALLMAAALEHRGAADLYRWSLTPASVQDAIAILDSHPRAPAGWATALTAVADSDPRQRDSVWMGVRQSLAALGDPDVLAAVTPGASEQFDPEAFITGTGTLYLVGTSTGAGAAANLVSALVEDILDVARHLAAASPGARLDPPVTVMLNEIGNLAPLPSLPTLMSEGGGTGICTWAILQSLAQARHRWGEQAAATVWDACTTKIVLGGGANATDLRDLSALIGDRDETTWAETRGGDGTRSRSSSLRRVPVLDPGRLRTLPFGSAVLLLRSVPPAVVKLHRWSDRRDKADASPPGRSPTVTAHPLIGRNSGLQLPVGTGGSTVGGPPTDTREVLSMRRHLAGLAAAVTLSLAACSSITTPPPTSAPGVSSLSDPTPAGRSTTSGRAASTVTDSALTTSATQSATAGSTVTTTPVPSSISTTTPPTTTQSSSRTASTGVSVTSSSSSRTSKTPPVTSTNSPSVTVTIPPEITGANREAAKAGVTAWRNAMHTFDLSLQDPTGKNWKSVIYRYMGDPAAAEQVLRIETFASHKIHQVGFTGYTATVTKATQKNVQIRACVDVTGMDVLSADGGSELKPGGAKRFYRDFSVTWYTAKKGGWLLNYITTPDPTKPC